MKQRRKLNYKKLLRLLIPCIMVFLLIWIIKLIPRNYKKIYKVNNISIIEKYDKETKLYYLTFSKGTNKYKFAIDHKYITKKELVTKAEIKNKCLSYKSKIGKGTLCKDKNGNDITSFYNDVNTPKNSSKYKNIKIYDLGKYKYFVWNYTDLLSINKKKNESIKIFESDKYNIDLATKFGEKIVIPDYDSEYYYSNIYVVNSKNNKVENVKLNKKIYFDSYFLGEYHNKLYLYDASRGKEYYLNIKKGRVEKTGYYILNNGVMEKTSKLKLDKKNLFFTEEKTFDYEVDKNILYYVTPVNKVKVTDISVTRIVDVIDDEVFFLNADTLYRANINDGVTKVMSYSEWQFNNKNIYIFSK